MTSLFPNPSGWFDLPYRELECRGLSIGPFDTGHALYAEEAGGSGIWMATSWQCIAELLSQIEPAYGRVLCTGLGMGLVPLLIADKDEVDSVVVIECDDRVIELFMAQGFDLSKIEIVQGDATTHRDERFDCLMLDHYNGYYELGLDFMMKEVAGIRANTKSHDAIAVPFRWTETEATSDSPIGLPPMTAQERERYVNAYTHAHDAIACTVESLKRIDSRRC